MVCVLGTSSLRSLEVLQLQSGNACATWFRQLELLGRAEAGAATETRPGADKLAEAALAERDYREKGRPWKITATWQPALQHVLKWAQPCWAAAKTSRETGQQSSAHSGADAGDRPELKAKPN